MSSKRQDVLPLGSTDGRRSSQSTVWDRLHAERRGSGAAAPPFDTTVNHKHFLSDGTSSEGPKVKLTDEQQRAKWANDLRSARAPSTRKQHGASGQSPYAWDDGTTQSAAAAKKPQEKASLPAGVKQAWASQIAEAQEPAAGFQKSSGDFHHKGDVHSGVLGHGSRRKALDSGPIIGDGTSNSMASFKKCGQGMNDAAQRLQWKKDLEASQAGPRFARKFAGALRRDSCAHAFRLEAML